MKRLTLQTAGRTTEVAISQPTREDPGALSVLIDGHEHTCQTGGEALHDGWILLDGQMRPYRSVRQRDDIYVWVDGCTYQFKAMNSTAQRAQANASADVKNAVIASMPGTILQINVQPGDRFDAHDALVVMESMKMEMTLSVAHAGTVKQVHCESGQLVDMGAVILTIEPTES